MTEEATKWKSDCDPDINSLRSKLGQAQNNFYRQNSIAYKVVYQYQARPTLSLQSSSIVYGSVYGDGQGCVLVILSVILALAKGYLDSYPGTVYRQPWLSRGYPVVSQKLHWLSITTVITIATYTVVSAPV